MMFQQCIDVCLATLIDHQFLDDRPETRIYYTAHDDLIAAPVFSLQKKSIDIALGYPDDGQLKISVSSTSGGTATIWDKDILLYVFSTWNERFERGLEVTSDVSLPIYALLKGTQRSTGKRWYELLSSALTRLRNTRIQVATCIVERESSYSFHWIEDIINAPTRGRGKSIVIRIFDYFTRAIIRDRSITMYRPEYFLLKKAIDRRLYELAC